MLKLAVFFVVCAAIDFAVSQNIVCYHTNWSQYRPDKGKFFPEEIDPNLCTHIMYSFAKVSANKLEPYEWNDESTDWSKGMYERTLALKAKNPSLKVLIAVGGWTHGSTEFSNSVSNDATRKQFVANIVSFVAKHNFDGLDLDWEYPANREGSKPSDRENFSKLVQELRAEFTPRNWLLTAAVAAGKPQIDSAYEVEKVCRDLDMINLMAYDLHGTWEPFTGHHAALYVRSDEQDDQRNLNVDWASKYWISKGCPASKLNLGLGTYGRAFKLVDPSKTGLGAPANGAPSAGTWTREGGFLSYYEVCERLSKGWTRVWNNEQAVPYAHQGGEWVGYDDEASLEVKVQYAKALNMGIMFWALDLDDFNGQFCGKGKYPLINKAKSIYLSNGGFSTPVPTSPTVTSTSSGISSTSVTGTASQTGTTAGVSSTTNSGSGKCYKGNGHYADKESGCRKYYVCDHVGTQFETIYYHDCPGGLLFDEALTICNYANLVACN